MQVTLLDYYFRFALRFATLTLAFELDSLVRVSRRDREIRLQQKITKWKTLRELRNTS
jgi:hypothetical protein